MFVFVVYLGFQFRVSMCLPLCIVKVLFWLLEINFVFLQWVEAIRLHANKIFARMLVCLLGASIGEKIDPVSRFFSLLVLSGRFSVVFAASMEIQNNPTKPLLPSTSLDPRISPEETRRLMRGHHIKPTVDV